MCTTQRSCTRRHSMFPGWKVWWCRSVVSTAPWPGDEQVSGESIHGITGPGRTPSGVPTDKLCPPGEPNKAVGARVPDRKVVPTLALSFLTDMTQGFLTNMTHPPRPVRVYFCPCPLSSPGSCSGRRHGMTPEARSRRVSPRGLPRDQDLRALGRFRGAADCGAVVASEPWPGRSLRR